MEAGQYGLKANELTSFPVGTETTALAADDGQAFSPAECRIAVDIKIDVNGTAVKDERRPVL